MNKMKLKTPTLILVAGVAASGKTTVSKELARCIYDINPISKDTINEAFLATHSDSDVGIFAYRFSGPLLPRNTKYYLNNVRLQSYYVMLQLAKDGLEVGKHPLLDGNYAKEICHGYIDKIIIPFFKGITLSIKIIICYADEEVIKKRIIERGYQRDIAKPKTKQAWKKFFQQEPILPPNIEEYDHIKINTGIPLKENILQVIKYLNS